MTVVVFFCAVFYYFCEFLFWMVLSRVQLLVLFGSRVWLNGWNVFGYYDTV